MVQVLLEGWGIEHYASMARDAQDQKLKIALGRILADEGTHHGSGLVLFSEKGLSSTDQDYLEVVLGSFLAMVRVGPLGVLSHLSNEAKLGAGERLFALRSMRAFETTQNKLNLLCSLMKKSGAHKLLSLMESRGLTTAMALEESSAL
jgi:hypothetical protein